MADGHSKQTAPGHAVMFIVPPVVYVLSCDDIVFCNVQGSFCSSEFEVLERELEELRPLKAENKSLQMQLQECRESRLTIGEENLKKEKESMSTIRRLENELMELRMMQATKKQVGFSICVILLC